MPERFYPEVLAIQASNLSFFLSAEITGTGANINTAHGLGRTPALVLLIPSKVATAGDTFVKGTVDGTNVGATVTTGSKYFIFAI